jgi:hypothetical protein
MIPSFRTIRVVLGLALAAGIAACFDWSRSTSTETDDIRVFIAGVEGPGRVAAQFNEGSPPVGGAGPTLTATIPEIVLKGGSAEVTFNSTTEFSRLVIAVDGVSGYYDLNLGTPTTSATILLIYAQDVGAPAFWIQYAAGGAGAVGPFATSNIAFLGNATGNVQVNLTWNSASDIDLYVVDPYGNEIYYNARGSIFVGVPSDDGSVPSSGGNVPGSSGGILDIDSNAGCASDGPRAENIVWPSGVVPPTGEYTVRVNNWSACGEPATDYVVTIRLEGAPPIIYRGRFTDAGVGGAGGAGHRVASFTY